MGSGILKIKVFYLPRPQSKKGNGLAGCMLKGWTFSPEFLQVTIDFTAAKESEMNNPCFVELSPHRACHIKGVQKISQVLYFVSLKYANAE